MILQMCLVPGCSLSYGSVIAVIGCFPFLSFYVSFSTESSKFIITPQSPSILRKTIEGYGFCFDFSVKGIIFSSQIINRYVAEPSLCKDSIQFSRCLEALLAALQKRWNTPEIEVPTVAYPTQFCHSSPLTGSFNCETVLIIEMPVFLCLKCILGKFQKSVIFG